MLLGIDVFIENPRIFKGRRIGIITNPTGIDREFRSVVDVLRSHPPVEVAAIFAPEHGFRGAEQAGRAVGADIDAVTGLPVYSLYGDVLKPTSDMLKGLDALVFDIQDVGARFYTYLSTMAYAMQAAAEHDLEFVVLDRPNPINGVAVEGPLVEEGHASFVGVYPIPIRHGMTVGELARYFNEAFRIGARLTVVPMRGWVRRMWFDQTGLKTWVMPSPNMPTLDTATVYPGTCLLEGTNLSEGRGTTRPFELVGAPYVNAPAFAAYLNARRLPGVVFRPVTFRPAFDRYRDEAVHGVQVHVVDREAFMPVRVGLEIIAAARALYPERFSFGERAAHFDRLVGNSWVRAMIERGEPLEAIVSAWQEDLRAFEPVRRGYLLYPEG